MAGREEKKRKGEEQAMGKQVNERKPEHTAGRQEVSLQTECTDATDKSLLKALKAKLGQFRQNQLQEIKQENDLVHQKASLKVLRILT